MLIVLINIKFLTFITSETENSATQTRLIMTQRDLVNLLKLLQSHSYQWKMIGLSLGFIDPELTTISNMHRLFMGAPTSFLQELLSQWVQWPTASHPTKPTLEALCAALQSSLVGLGSLADKVNEEMRQSTGMTQFKYYTLCYNIILVERCFNINGASLRYLCSLAGSFFFFFFSL